MARRSILVRPMSRCFCLWLCACSCIASFAIVDTSDLCKDMSLVQANEAGFQSEGDMEQQNEVFNWIAIFPLTMLVLGFFIVLGNYIKFFIFYFSFDVCQIVLITRKVDKLDNFLSIHKCL